ncbi:MAG: DUF1080 domain-containing protein [Verrucomicrobiales bacterium]
MIKHLFFTVLSFVVLASSSSAGDGFQTIYDGNDLSQIKTKGNWRIQEDGSLYLEPREGEEGWKRYDAYIWLKEDYEDFVFDFEYKHEEGGNSGLYFRVGDEADPVASGFEVQILDCYGMEELGPHDLGGVIKTAGPLANGSKPAGQWNRMVVTLEGGKLTVIINGTKVQDGLDLAAAKPKDKTLAPSGKISIQDHGLKFWVRNLKVKRL